jgi:hypothetical protein
LAAIEDFHYQATIDKSTLTIDGRALFDQNDYKLSLDLRRDDVGYLRFSYDEFRTWSNGDGGYYRPPTSGIRCPTMTLAPRSRELSLSKAV